MGLFSQRYDNVNIFRTMNRKLRNGNPREQTRFPMHVLTFSGPLSPGPALPGLGLGPGPAGLGPFLPGGPGLGWKRGRHFPWSSPRLLMHRV